MTEIDPKRRTEDICDYDGRAFARMPGEPAICPSCGFENPRPVETGTVSLVLPAESSERLETGMLLSPVAGDRLKRAVVHAAKRRRK